MQRIRLLDDQVANQIAAGEVVDRPASIVKELVENAIDAGATRIQVDIEAGGRNLVRVTDNGHGMNRDDALLSLQRHATSKIRNADDLFRIASMGFRGEALPSIASISRFCLTTREHDSRDPAGTRIIVQGGRLVDVQAGTGAEGTCVEVRQLFHNLPARRKFLRSVDTERTHIQHTLLTMALAWPRIGFSYRHDGKSLWQLPPREGDGEGALALLQERWRELNGDAGPMLALEAGTTLRARGFGEQAIEEEHPVRLWGIIGAPGVSRSSRADMHWFVNRRPVGSLLLARALLEGYHTSLMKGRHPLSCLFLEMPPELVDVNVHPSKREIRFRDEAGIRRLVEKAVGNRLESHASPEAPEATARAQVPDAPPPQAPDAPPPVIEESPPDPPPRKRPRTPPPPAATGEERPPAETCAPERSRRHPAVLDDSLRPIGILSRLYILLESPEGLVLVDQHAAHERILYERLLDQLERGSVPSQALLLPESVELGARDMQFVREHRETLARLGLMVREESERIVRLEALPPFARTSNPRRYLLDVIDELAESGEGVNSVRLGEDVIAMTVCRQAIKANDSLRPGEVEQLVRDLRGCRMPYTCPHGRPTVIGITRRELDRRFGRTL